jgi:hypothetical protein
MSIIPPEIPITIPNPADYVFTDPSTTQKLDNPSHSQLHTKINDAVETLNGRVSITETNVNKIWPQIEQARLVANTWLVHGQLVDEEIAGKLMLPPIWNVTARPVLFDAARATVYTAPLGQEISIDIVTGPTITGELPDDTAHSILNEPLTIAPGTFTSDIITRISNGFIPNAFHAVGWYVAAVVSTVGTTAPGADLTIQLNRML